MLSKKRKIIKILIYKRRDRTSGVTGELLKKRVLAPKNHWKLGIKVKFSFIFPLEIDFLRIDEGALAFFE